jgi:Ca2+-binding EF-hand superfamily protein
MPLAAHIPTPLKAFGFLVVAFGIIAGSFMAYAWEHRDPSVLLQAVVKKFDADGDGKLQYEEAPSMLKDKYDILDTNGDGAIDAEEAAHPGEGNSDTPADEKIPLREVIIRFDTNKDGKLQYDEAPARMQKSFKFIDRNKDGVFDNAEADIIEKIR